MFSRAEMFNKRASASEFKSNEVIKNLNIKKGSIIADIGSGGGFYSMLFAAETGETGVVYAVDMNKKYLDYIKFKSEKNGFMNIKTVTVGEELLGLPKNGCDLIFLRNSYHHIPKPENYFLKLKKFLNVNGRVIIIDYKKTDKFSFINLNGHYTDEKDIINCMKKCGYTHLNSFNFIEKQSFNIFKI